jgi:hypothetical protein
MLSAFAAAVLLSTVAQQQPPALIVPAQEREILLGLFSATDGERWTKHTGWGTSQPVCEWYGVVCDFVDADVKRPAVAGLNLAANNLRGQLPASLAKLQYLRSLDVSRNRLSGDVPELLLRRWDNHAFEFDGDGNPFSGFVTHATVELSGSSALCATYDDVRFRFEVHEVTGRTTFQSIRCSDGQSRRTYCLVREGTTFALGRFSRALKALGSAKFRAEYDYPFSGVTHPSRLRTSVVWGDGTKMSVQTYDRQGPHDVWVAQQLFLGLLSEASWDREFRKPRCDFDR